MSNYIGTPLKLNFIYSFYISDCDLVPEMFSFLIYIYIFLHCTQESIRSAYIQYTSLRLAYIHREFGRISPHLYLLDFNATSA